MDVKTQREPIDLTQLDAAMDALRKQVLEAAAKGHTIRFNMNRPLEPVYWWPSDPDYKPENFGGIRTFKQTGPTVITIEIPHDDV